MFWALKGTTSTPASASSRHNPAVTTLLPTSDAVPSTASADFTVTRCSAPTCRDEVCGQGGIGPEMKMDVAQQRPADHEPLGPRGASAPIGDGVQTRDRRRDVPEPGAMKLVAARPRACGPQRPGRGERHLAIADHEPAALHDDWHREHAGHRPHVTV